MAKNQNLNYETYLLKKNIIIDVLQIIEDGTVNSNLIDNVKKFAKYFKVPLVSFSAKEDLIKSLRLFVSNEEGYNLSLKRLNNSLI